MRAYLRQLEIPARDPDALAGFYRRAFGWRAEEVPWEGGRYLRLTPPEGEPPPPAGASLVSAGAAGIDRPLAVIQVEGGVLEEWLGRVAIAGGSLEGAPLTVGESGRFARFRDPEGNLLGLWHGVVGRPG